MWWWLVFFQPEKLIYFDTDRNYVRDLQERLEQVLKDKFEKVWRPRDVTRWNRNNMQIFRHLLAGWVTLDYFLMQGFFLYGMSSKKLLNSDNQSWSQSWLYNLFTYCIMKRCKYSHIIQETHSKLQNLLKYQQLWRIYQWLWPIVVDRSPSPNTIWIHAINSRPVF